MKKKVKEELKLYDNMFYQTFKKFPTRAEKEPLRPLYMYYKKLKQGIEYATKQRKSSVANSVKEDEFSKAKQLVVNVKQRRSYDASQPTETDAISDVDDTVLQPVIIAHPNNANVSLTSNNSSQNNFRRLAKKHLKGYNSQNQNSHREILGGKNKVIQPYSEVKVLGEKVGKGGKMVNSARGSKVNTLSDEINKENCDSKHSQNSSKGESVSRAELDKQIKDLVKRREKMIKERKKLRSVLDQFQNAFLLQHGRKIKYMHDVKEVQTEYSKYKSLKTDIAKAEEKLKSMLAL